jgi:hypothetical protein
MKFAAVKSRVILVAWVFCSLIVVGSTLQPQKAAAYTCLDNGLACDVGYFSLTNLAAGVHHNLYYGNDYTWGGSPFLLGLRANNIGDLTGLIKSRLNCTNNANAPTNMVNQADQNATGAAFTVLTMLGAAPGTSKNAACQRYNEWASIVTKYDQAGLIHYSEWHNLDGINTRLSTNAGTDVTYYADNAPPSDTSIVFYAADGSGPVYAIKRDCGNPIGRQRGPLTLNFNLNPIVNAAVNGSAPSGPAEAGDTITFNYQVQNTGNTASADNISCTITGNIRSGYYTGPGGASSGTPATNCPRSFPRSSTSSVTATTETIVATANTTVCRTLTVTPVTQSGGTRNATQCIAVAAKPYMQVYGGDISAGDGLETAPSTCTNNNNAAIVGWNKRNVSSAGYAGAGAQYAAFALNAITDFATAQANTGTVTKPSGFSFANTTTSPTTGNFGGNFGSATCTTDYYSQRPTTTQPLSSVIHGTVIYGASGLTTFPGGTLSAGDRWTIYVDGDLYVAGNIAFPASWTTATAPYLQVVVRGNIYISGSVTQLDGNYIAQVNPATGTGGTIATCATSTGPYATAAGAFYTPCNNKLTVNGSFTANSVMLMRTANSLNQSNAAETSGSNRAAEQFNYNPALWMVQPAPTSTGSGRVDNYDAITSLPPVL